MKKTLLILLLTVPLLVTAQNVKIPKGANEFTYWQIEYGEQNDTTEVYVHRDGDVITIVTQQPKGKLIPGYAQTVTKVDYAQDSITVNAYYDDSIYFYRTGFSRSDIEWRHDGNKHICSINSNTLEFEMDEKAPVNVNPLPHYGLNKGVLRSFIRNGQKRLVLAKAEKISWDTFENNQKGKKSIEHIYPQTPTDSYWTSRFDTEDKKALTHSLGNLLLLSVAKNSVEQNDSFDVKKETKRNDRGVITHHGYETGSHSEILVSKENDWTPERITERGKNLLDFMIRHWDINHTFTEEENNKLLNI